MYWWDWSQSCAWQADEQYLGLPHREQGKFRLIVFWQLEFSQMIFIINWGF